MAATGFPGPPEKGIGIIPPPSSTAGRTALTLLAAVPAARLFGGQFFQQRPQLVQGPAAVAEGVFDARAQLAERLVVFGDEEERVVAEPALAPGRAEDDA